MARLPWRSAALTRTGARAGVLALAALASLTALTALTGCSGAAGAEGDYLMYSSADELFAAAPLIVVGTVESSEDRDVNSRDIVDPDDPVENPSAGTGREPDDSTLEFTIYTVRIDEVVGGSEAADVAPGDTIEVERPRAGGIALPDASLAPPEPQLTMGDTYALFVRTNADQPAALTTPTQSLYRLGDDGAFTSVVADNPIADAVVRQLAERD